MQPLTSLAASLYVPAVVAFLVNGDFQDIDNLSLSAGNAIECHSPLMEMVSARFDGTNVPLITTCLIIGLHEFSAWRHGLSIFEKL